MTQTLKDPDIREPLFDFLEEKYGQIRILEEKQIGRSRADILMITPDSIFGIEIKSDADTYARLKSQIRDYDRYCDYNYIAAGTSHAQHIAEHVPDWWGIITVEMADGMMDFYVMREPKQNPKVKTAGKLALLWRPELARIQDRCRMPAYRQKSKKFVQQKILEKLSEEMINSEIITELMERDYTLIEGEIETFRKSRQK